ncbi:hypothetical protein GGR56DRAFT_652046 [Xylariaceae sp. FL0804]|nr:hypothetical protein GGR56DRAFT_652046 [Xylariaceae sp. FL0804]
MSDISNISAAGNPAATSRFHSKRPHRKSRRGCKQCKRRKVKCSEERPVCEACFLRKEDCHYFSTDALSSQPSAASLIFPHGPFHHRQRPNRAIPLVYKSLPSSTSVPRSPVFRPDGIGDNTDMKMLWFYTIEAYASWEIHSRHSATIEHVLRVELVQYAFASPFLMQFILAVAAMHIRHHHQVSNRNSSPGEEDEEEAEAVMPRARLLAYLSRACEGYRKAIGRMDPSESPALMAASLLVPVLYSETLRSSSASGSGGAGEAKEGREGQGLVVVDWLALWQGPLTISEAVAPEQIHRSGLAPLFYRPVLELETAALAVPAELRGLLDCPEMQDSPPATREVYHYVLQVLAHVYAELREGRGFQSTTVKRFITLGAFLPAEFVARARERRPLALVILTHFCAFSKLLRVVWWMRGFPDQELRSLIGFLGEKWEPFLQMPLRVVGLSDVEQVARVILGDENWCQDQDVVTGMEPGSQSSSSGTSDPDDEWVLTNLPEGRAVQWVPMGAHTKPWVTHRHPRRSLGNVWVPVGCRASTLVNP